MNGFVGFENHRILCILGVMPEERKKSQTIFVDLKVEIDITKSAQTDNLKDTIDYVELAKICTTLALENQYQLLEAYVVDVLGHLFNKFTIIHSAWIKVKKPLGLPSAAYSLIELYQKRN
jgi:dihydroneopterin aldolase